MSDLAVTPQAASRLVPAAALAAVLAAASAAWVVLAGRMAGMDAGPGGDPGALGWFAATWAIMTVAMMLPASAPAVVGLVRGWHARAPAAGILFVAGYGAVWMLAGFAGYALVQAVRGLHPGLLGWSSAGRYVDAAALLAAGLYQLTPVKRRWLERCIAPDLPLPGRGTAGALRAGVEHGGCCVACCWTLMAALYALGVMSLTWMAVVTVLIVGERVLRPSAITVRAVAAVLIVLGIAVAAAPASVPGLTIPNMSMPAMTGMNG
ncbi:MAG: DUF2182 domain-containing protein [Solirubrobacteraceae bacterium]